MAIKDNPLYANIEFPDYEFREFPKWVTPKGGEPVLCNDEAEEATALAGDEVIREEDVHVQLLEEAEVKGVKVDKRWGNDRLRSEIDAATAPKA